MRIKSIASGVILGMLAGIFVALPSASLAQGLFKHVDEKGAVTYTDVPLTSDEKRLAISNTVRNGDGSRAASGGKQKASAGDDQKSKGKGATRGRKQKGAGKAGDTSQN
jgi:uncharacterized protein DUF4124